MYEVTIVKENGYNQWTNAVLNGAPTTNTSPATTYAPNVGNKSANTTAATTAPRSNYETPEERAKKQIYIVRQSSISNAVDLLSVGAKSAPDIDKVLEAAKRFEEFVFGDAAAVSEADAADSFFPDSPKPRNPELDDDIPF